MLFIHYNFFLHKCDESVAIELGIYCTQVIFFYVLQIDLIDWLHLFVDVKLREIVNDCDMVDIAATGWEETVSAVLGQFSRDINSTRSGIILRRQFLYRQEQWIIEKVHFLHERYVLLDFRHNSFDVIRVELEEALLVFSQSSIFACDQVAVFHRLKFTFSHNPIMPTPFDIINLGDSIWNAGRLNGVLHQKQVHRCDSFHCHLENTVNPSDDRVGILLQMCEILRQVQDHDV